MYIEITYIRKYVFVCKFACSFQFDNKVAWNLIQKNKCDPNEQHVQTNVNIVWMKNVGMYIAKNK